MVAANFRNRTFWVGDNLKVMRGINSGCVDLVYLDPPFNSKRIYHAPLGSEAAGATFQDTWTMNGIKDEWAELQKHAHPALYHTVVGAGLTADESMQAYLTFMSLRVIEIHRILARSGSVYLHCDPHASHYLKQLMDCVFGAKNFRNEVVWSYRTGGVSKRYWPRKHDILLFYVRSDDYNHTPLKERIIYEKPFFSTQTDSQGRHYTDVYIRDVWENGVKPIINTSKERTGWPTQKPLVLLERILEASSKADDMILDPFAGCATTCVAAEKMGRRWAGIDIDQAAVQVTKERLQKVADDAATLETGQLPTLHLPEHPPTRTDPIITLRSPNIRDIRWNELPADTASNNQERRKCPGCDRHKYFEDFELDHIHPRSKGGVDTDNNLQLLCSTCNRTKSNSLSMKELRKKRFSDLT